MNDKVHKITGLKMIVVLCCLTALSGVIISGFHYYQSLHPTEDEAIRATIDDIQPGDTAEMVRNVLGPPDKISESDWKEKDIVTEMPQQIWHYNVGHASFRIYFEPNGLEHWDDPMKWCVLTKGY